MSINWRGVTLTQQHLNLMVPLLNEGMSDRKLLKAADKAFTDAGISIPLPTSGTPVRWELEGVKDKGRVISWDERTGKVRVLNNKGRKFTVPQRSVTLITKEEPDVDSDSDHD